jgi:hypothetical protein
MVSEEAEFRLHRYGLTRSIITGYLGVLWGYSRNAGLHLRFIKPSFLVDAAISSCMYFNGVITHSKNTISPVFGQ